MDISAVMTPDPVVCSPDTELQEVARIMRDRQVGDVIVSDDGGPCGIVTDRDIVVTALADGQLIGATIGDICGHELYSVDVDASIDDVIAVMESNSVRRVPVLRDGRAVGIVSIGDLADRLDPGSLLGKISAAPPDRP